MELKTFRAATMYEALAMVRRELGPDAAVLHTREVQTRRLFGWVAGPREIEVTASCGVNVPSRLPQRNRLDTPTAPDDEEVVLGLPETAPPPMPQRPMPAPPPAVPPEMQSQLTELQAMVQELCRRSETGGRQELPEEMFRLFTDLLDSDLSEDLARELVDRVRRDTRGPRFCDAGMAKDRIAQLVESEIAVAGPIRVTPGQRRLAALVGPTGVGKTTTIAKLAAHYRLKEKRRVGLITVDTYRIAAVEQLRTYADIIDLPMQVVSTPREMHDAVCSSCGKNCQVPFQPSGEKPVYCSDCFQSQRSNRW